MTTPFYDMPQYQAFLAAIRAKPDCDLVRLVAADFVEEYGDAERAEFIRVQVELAKTPELVWRNKLIHRAEWDAISRDRTPWGERFVLASPTDSIGVYHYRETNEGYSLLARRQEELWDSNKCRWWGEREFIHYLGSEIEDAEGQFPESPKTFASRGFVTRVSGPLVKLIGEECGRCGGSGMSDREYHGVTDSDGGCPACSGTGQTTGVLRELVRREPVMEVVTDREPWSSELESSDDDYSWWREDEWRDRTVVQRNSVGNLPDKIFDTIGEMFPEARLNWGYRSNEHLNFPTREAANAALSAAILEHVQEVPK